MRGESLERSPVKTGSAIETEVEEEEGSAIETEVVGLVGVEGGEVTEIPESSWGGGSGRGEADIMLFRYAGCEWGRGVYRRR
jgi:hypothetical protein